MMRHETNTRNTHRICTMTLEHLYTSHIYSVYLKFDQLFNKLTRASLTDKLVNPLVYAHFLIQEPFVPGFSYGTPNFLTVTIHV